MSSDKISPEQRHSLQLLLETYQMKNLDYKQLYEIYRKNALTQQFRTTLYSALILIFAPSLTNMYYTFRPNATFSRILPLAMPIVCLIQYGSALKYDLQNFCFKETDDAQQLRKKYMNICKLQINDKRFQNLAQKIDSFYRIKQNADSKQSKKIQIVESQ